MPSGIPAGPTPIGTAAAGSANALAGVTSGIVSSRNDGRRRHDGRFAADRRRERDVVPAHRCVPRRARSRDDRARRGLFVFADAERVGDARANVFAVLRFVRGEQRRVHVCGGALLDRCDRADELVVPPLHVVHRYAGRAQNRGGGIERGGDGVADAVPGAAAQTAHAVDVHVRNRCVR